MLVFDIIRKKYVILTPEEWVRQHSLHFLIEEKKYPPGRFLVERQLKVAALDKRVDIAVCDPKGKIQLLVECKAPEVVLNQKSLIRLPVITGKPGPTSSWLQMA